MLKIVSGNTKTYKLDLKGSTFIAYEAVAGKDLAASISDSDNLGFAVIINLLFSFCYTVDKNLDYSKFIDDEDLIKDIMSEDFVSQFIEVITEMFTQYNGGNNTQGK